MIKLVKMHIADWLLSKEMQPKIKKLPDWAYGPVLRWAFEHTSDQAE